MDSASYCLRNIAKITLYLEKYYIDNFFDILIVSNSSFSVLIVKIFLYVNKVKFLTNYTKLK